MASPMDEDDRKPAAKPPAEQLPPPPSFTIPTPPPAAIHPNKNDLPFLVTHWLSQFQPVEEEKNEECKAAMNKLQRATADIASAFSLLGAYGSSFAVSCTKE